MKKESNSNLFVKIFVIAYIAILMIPAIVTFTSFGKDTVNTENRTLAAFPVIKTEEGINTNYFVELNDWISDHIGLRSFMVKANTFINTKIFNNSPEESIILGKNGWLYYEDTVKDYINTPTISEKDAENVAITLSLLQESVNARGALFVFTIAPNKSTLYSENMPYYFAKNDAAGNMELIENAVREKNVNYADIRNAFINDYANSGEVLYQKQDSHWNYKGALLGYHTILDSLGIEDKVFSNTQFESRQDWDSDLAGMLYSDAAVADTQLYPVHDFTYERTSRDKAVDAIRISTVQESGQHNALIFRDSFFNTLQIYFAESFNNVIFSRAYPYNLELMNEVGENGADVVILEIVERNLPNLAKKAPIMEAPIFDVKLPPAGVLKENEIFIYKDGMVSYVPNTMYSVEYNGFTHYYGTIDTEYEGMICYFSDGKVYKVCPIYEQELLESEELRDNGFSFYLKVK